jgi:hypothetical protein
MHVGLDKICVITSKLVHTSKSEAWKNDQNINI